MAFADGDVLGQVAVVVAHGVQGAVLLVVGIEVAAGGLEVGRFAERLLVDVDGVLADGKVLEVELDGEFALFLLEGGSAGVLAGAGLEGDDDFIFGFAKAGTARRQTARAAKVRRMGFLLIVPDVLRCFK